ncbi:polysaccharide biosynthesis C-terminal domain-containing protein [Terribacillus saccharophilus]|uniref:oligosaccharide flippase family protein n=1 Tax=Terribacillus saccharophilus TaxID=361277 RepID=UPI003D2A241F
MKAYQKLLSNSIIFAIGNIGNKFIIFLLIPMYTYYLSVSEYGEADLITTTISLLVPIFSISISEAILRYAMDESVDREALFTSTIVIFFIGFIVSLLFAPLINMALPFSNNFVQFYLLLLIQCLYMVFSQYARGIGEVRIFAWSSILNAITMLIITPILLGLFNLGVKGYIYTFLFSFGVGSIYIYWNLKIYKLINFSKVSYKLSRTMILYSIPLIPNSIMWWVMSFSDRYLISFFLGMSANGLYAVANKIPSVINIFNTIFIQAWQLSAVEEDSSDRSNFYSSVFKYLSGCMLIATSLILIFLKGIMGVVVSEEFYSAWEYVPFLLLGIVFSCFSGFLGTTYIVQKKTFAVLRTSFLGAVLNIIITLILLPLIGLNGASLATCLSFLSIWLLRSFELRKHVKIKLDKLPFLLSFMVILIQIYLLYNMNSFANLSQLTCFLLLLIIQIKIIKRMIKLAFVLINKKLNKRKQ